MVIASGGGLDFSAWPPPRASGATSLRVDRASFWAEPSTYGAKYREAIDLALTEGDLLESVILKALGRA